VKASHKSSISREILDSEAKKLYKCLVVYAKSYRDEGITDFSIILDSFYSDVLDLDPKLSSRGIKSSLTRRFKRLMRKNRVDDPKCQKTLDDFI
jgi:hypothetical protein